MKIKTWIETHKLIWMGILFFSGISLGLLQSFLLQSQLRQTLTMGIVYGMLLPTVEVCCGGSGVN